MGNEIESPHSSVRDKKVGTYKNQYDMQLHICMESEGLKNNSEEKVILAKENEESPFSFTDLLLFEGANNTFCVI